MNNENNNDLIYEEGFVFTDKEEQRQFHNRMWYYKVYNQLIDKGIQREINGELDSEGYYEKHHILPKCMGGKNEKGNYVKLTAREHIMAHILLANIYPDNPNILLAANCMTNVANNNTVIYRKTALKTFSTKIIANIRTESQKLVGKLRKGKKKSEEMKRKLSNSKKGILFSEEHKEKLSKAKLGKHLSKETKEKMASKRKGKDNPAAKKVISPNGEVYDTIRLAAKAYNISRTMLSKWLNHNPEKGWKFYHLKD